MKQITVPGKDVRYWDFELEEKAEDGTVVAKGDWNRRATEVNVTAPESVQEIMDSANGDEARLIEIVIKGLVAEAQDKAGQIPDSAFSRAMVAAIDIGYRAMPQFAGIKEMPARRKAIMRYVGANEALRNGLAVGFAHLRNVQLSDSE